MLKSEGFFSPDHNRLLSIATWAKYLAWVALIVAFLAPIGILNISRTNYELRSMMDAYPPDFLQELKMDPGFAFSVFLDMADSLIDGLSFFLGLKAVSLGLNMIVETDINYRERKKEAGAK